MSASSRRPLEGAEDSDAAASAFPPGPTLRIAQDALEVEIAPQAGGRIARIVMDGTEWLAGYGESNAAMIAWGCYPMLPWAGRLRCGLFEFQDRWILLPRNLGRHAIHGIGFALPWQVLAQTGASVELRLELPSDRRWPFGGSAWQRIAVGDRQLRLDLRISAGSEAMPAEIGWHPWLPKPERLEFDPVAVYPRDADGVATLPLGDVPAPPWDDCFLASGPVRVSRAGRTLVLSSDCTRWALYDEPADATCIEPQSGPPDAFNIEPRVLQPGESLSAWFLWEWP